MLSLMDQWSHLKDERDNLLEALDLLGSTIRRHPGGTTASEPASGTSLESSACASTEPTAPTNGG